MLDLVIPFRIYCGTLRVKFFSENINMEKEKQDQIMDRRNFIKSSCSFCLLAGAGIAATQLSSCSPKNFNIFKTTLNGNQISVPLNVFENSSLQIVRPAGLYYDIAVQKKEDNSYEALVLLCTHQENQLTVTGNGYNCSLHGSQFNKDGKVLKGPASRPLEKFKTSISGNNLIIQNINLT